ncbi:hypothetical protein HHK36_011901 [Tetracentron sinense]|uniref:Cation/H+ exchanger domain-containing protein n=1 Tax=Tetracentron sinense TaxID=13715 RepID=A0A834ZDN8_TETSI|nr:hypothetical protein HHK36_011901 [Tetracentron sinense]
MDGEDRKELKILGSKERCQDLISMTFANFIAYVLGYFFIFFACNFIHSMLRPLSQPRIISESIVGLIVGNLNFITKAFGQSVPWTLYSVAEIGMLCYMFALGLEMDPYVLVHRPTREAKVAYAGMLSTFLLSCIFAPLMNFFSTTSKLEFIIFLALAISNPASPLLTRLITDLKIGKSDIGKLVIAAGIHSDMVSTLLMAICTIISKSRGHAFVVTLATVVQMMLIAKFGSSFICWINDQNPKGKPMKGSHLVLSVAFMVFICAFAPVIWAASPIFSAFLAGLVLPREGRLSKMVISKLNYFWSSFLCPVYFFWAGLQADFDQFNPGKFSTWSNLFFLFMVATIGKISGTLVSGMLSGLQWQESIAIGLLLGVKGHFHIYLAVFSGEVGIISTSSSIVMIIVTLLTIVYIPLVVEYIISRARQRSNNPRMVLQWLDPSSELRMLLCLQGPQNLTTAINFMEISRGTAEPGIMVYATDMIELTDQVASTLIHREGVEAVTVTDESIVEMREQITAAIQAYMEESGKGITLRRMLALSTFNNMHQEICVLAEDALASLIILPFHKRQRGDGKLDEGHLWFRHVNRKVLRHAPCSVGILVDRGLGLTGKVSKSLESLKVGVIFIGGKDDREALAYAGRIAGHPGINLTAIRFLLDSNADNGSIRARSTRHAISEQEEEMKLDDECFAEFYERFLADGRVTYVEKYVVNAAETVSTLRTLEGLYALFVVGRGHRVDSILTAGMSDWEECPELGPVGGILAASDFSVMASVLIIQQHSPKGDLHGLDDEFSVI